MIPRGPKIVCEEMKRAQAYGPGSILNYFPFYLDKIMRLVKKKSDLLHFLSGVKPGPFVNFLQDLNKEHEGVVRI